MMVEEAPKGSVTEDKTSINPTTNTNPRLLRDGGEVDDEPEEGEIVCEHDSESSNPSKGLDHPLQYSWNFWFDNTSAKSKQEVWGISMRKICSFTTIEDFWGVYNNICRPSKLPTGADFYCFKNEIEPKWEDPVCANGGKWTMSFHKLKSDTCWLYTLLAMIGEQFEHGDDICGAVVNVRLKQERISIWTKNASNKAAQTKIGKQWKEFVDYNESIGFIFHEDSIRLERNAKDKYTV